MSGELSAFELSDDAESLYRWLLRSETADLAAHATELGWALERAAAALQQLIGVGLVRGTADRQLVVEHPRAALEQLIEGEEARLEERRRDLSRARTAIGQFVADHQVGQTERMPGRRPPLELLSTQLAAGAIEAAIRSTSGTIRHSLVSVDIGPGTASGNRRAARAALAGGRELRAIYPLAALDTGSGRSWMRSWAAQGERQRVSHRPPSDFVAFGSEVVFAVAQWRVPTADYLLIRDPMLVEAFTTVFDLAWAQALPLPATDGPDTDQRLLTLLASGMQDEAIARHLGWGLRTVRRRVAALMVELDAATRFQLGAAAQRRGMLDMG